MPAAFLALKIAEVEARNAGSEYIEPEHIFIGLLSPEKVLGKKSPSANDRKMERVAEEWEAIVTLLGIAGHNATVLRRLTRAAHPRGKSDRDRRRVPLSQAGIECILRAIHAAGGRTVTAAGLFSAVMVQPGTIIHDVLAEARKCIAADRRTDVLLPSVTSLIAGGRPMPSLNSDDIRNLFDEIGRYRNTHKQWMQGSDEYSAIRLAINRNVAALAVSFLEKEDSEGLISALMLAVPSSTEEELSCAEIITAIGELRNEGKTLPDDLKSRINELLKKLLKDDRGRKKEREK
ncbi:MAG: hypothetical protein A4E35_01971 [Methanoregula sp. PtaU1.Bin051]|nr:MAG: hypothetical protein A4E35_01971 [Methanoregula sp. PtaU1.Bin051]